MNISLEHRAENTTVTRLENEFSTICLDRKAIFALENEWESLSSNAVEENPFYSPTFMRAALENIDGKCDIKALAVYHGASLVGFCPFVIDKWRWLGASSVNKAWINPYATLTIPLVDRCNPREVVTELLTAMGEHGAAGKFWLFENFNLDGPVGALFAETLKAKNLTAENFDEFHRPTLDHGSTFDQHMLDHVSKKRRKSLRRNRKKLSDMGRVEMRSFTSGPELKAAVEDFLTIEASGWKGRQATALACNQNSLDFARSAFGDAQGKSITRADVLYLNQQPIAVSLAIFTGRTAFTLKCAYDEEYRSCGPGLLLEQDIIEDFFKSRWADRLDSAVTTSGHVLEGLWNSSIRVGDLLLCADGRKSIGSFQKFARMENLRRQCRRKLKNIVAKYQSDAL